MEAYAEKHDFPIIGPACGYYCYQLARMINAKSIFELGSGYGYSTAWFAKALRDNGGGVVHHTVWDEDLSKSARSHLLKMGSDAFVQYHVSEAVEALRQTDGPFDIIFNDIDKQAYPASLPVIKEKLRSGGLLIIDGLVNVIHDIRQDPHHPFRQQLDGSFHVRASGGVHFEVLFRMKRPAPALPDMDREAPDPE